MSKMSELHAEVHKDERVAHAARSHDVLVRALEEIETICTESAGDCRKRMGTRVGNALVAARTALAFARGAT